MTIVALDDTDSRERGMCTTYLAALVGEDIVDAGGSLDGYWLLRLNPAVEHKTRGNAALAIETDLAVEAATEIATAAIESHAIGEDPHTSPGLVVAPGDRSDVPAAVQQFGQTALREIHSLNDAIELADTYDYTHRGWAAAGCETIGRGRIGALAAIGSMATLAEPTYEHISYRVFDRCGTPRDVDYGSVVAAADVGYPTVWDTIDRVEEQAVCVPHAPGPILHGVRGDDPDACRRVASLIESESVDRAVTFQTNQGTDAHLRAGTIGSLREDRGYRANGIVASDPHTKRGGHVFFDLAPAVAEADASVREGPTIDCAAFEPTKRFRDRVRALRKGDRITACGEVSDGTLKLEKFAVRSLLDTEQATPTCPECGRTMKSAGRNAGYRCRDCGTNAAGKVEAPIDRAIEPGWYEVPPCARRHIAKPLVRGGFDGPIHPER